VKLRVFAEISLLRALRFRKLNWKFAPNAIRFIPVSKKWSIPQAALIDLINVTELNQPKSLSGQIARFFLPFYLFKTI
jgi:hypothetical protein